jgi:5-methylcytosine-specific restriction endonuclease McrA
MFDIRKLERMINSVPVGNFNKKVKRIQYKPGEREALEARDKGICFLCGAQNPYGSTNIYSCQERNYKLSHLHHRSPIRGNDPNNIVTLCVHCHQIVHQILFVDGRAKFSRPL